MPTRPELAEALREVAIRMARIREVSEDDGLDALRAAAMAQGPLDAVTPAPSHRAARSRSGGEASAGAAGIASVQRAESTR